jgi:hypothetical protein
MEKLKNTDQQSFFHRIKEIKNLLTLSDIYIYLQSDPAMLKIKQSALAWSGKTKKT